MSPTASETATSGDSETAAADSSALEVPASSEPKIHVKEQSEDDNDDDDEDLFATDDDEEEAEKTTTTSPTQHEENLPPAAKKIKLETENQENPEHPAVSTPDETKPSTEVENTTTSGSGDVDSTSFNAPIAKKKRTREETEVSQVSLATNAPSSSSTERAIQLGLPTNVIVPHTVTSQLLTGRLLETLQSLPPNLQTEALNEFHDAILIKTNVRNPGGYLFGVLKRYTQVHERALREGSHVLPMGPDLTPLIHSRLDKMVEMGFCSPEEMDDKIRSKIRGLCEKDAILALDELERNGRGNIQHLGSFFMGIMTKFMRGEHNIQSPDQNRRGNNGHDGYGPPHGGRGRGRGGGRPGFDRGGPPGGRNGGPHFDNRGGSSRYQAPNNSYAPQPMNQSHQPLPEFMMQQQINASSQQFQQPYYDRPPQGGAANHPSAPHPSSQYGPPQGSYVPPPGQPASSSYGSHPNSFPYGQQQFGSHHQQQPMPSSPSNYSQSMYGQPHPHGGHPNSYGGGGPPHEQVFHQQQQAGAAPGGRRRASARLEELPVNVQFSVQNIISTGLVPHVDEGLLGMIFDLPEQMALESLARFSSIDRSTIRNPTGYLAGLLRRELEKIQMR